MLDSRQRNLLVTNSVAMIFGTLCFVLFTILVLSFGFTINSPVILGLSLFFLLIPYLNKKGFINLGRVLLSTLPPAITLMAALFAKIFSTSFTDILYYDARFFLVLLGILPCLIFDTTESSKLFGSLAVVLAMLLLFDPVHEFFDVGYFQKGFKSGSYYYINYVTVITFAGIVAGAISLKIVIERAERKNLAYEIDLVRQNERLTELLNNVETQNEEIISQTEELQTSQEKLIAANVLIEKQNALLKQQVIQVNSTLEETNAELIKHNNELSQFSYTISHNLRGPIARLLGLTTIADLSSSVSENPEAATIIEHIKTSAGELDHVIRDLSKIVDARNSTDQIRQQVDFNQEWKQIKSLLQITPELEAESFSIDFSIPFIHSVKSLINSILFNLISNTIKYQSPVRKLAVSVKTYRENTYVVVEVGDNGLGIDLSRYQDDMFKLYKRFHGHLEGRGIGLYLVKSQAESLNGFVQVFSEPNAGTIFKVFIRDSEAV